MKNLTLLTTILLCSSTAFAGTTNIHKETILQSETVSSAEQAYEAGYVIIDKVNAMSSNELRYTLPTFTDSMVTNLKVDDIKVRIEAFSKERNNIKYRALVEVDYQYNAKDTD